MNHYRFILIILLAGLLAACNPAQPEPTPAPAAESTAVEATTPPTVEPTAEPTAEPEPTTEPTTEPEPTAEPEAEAMAPTENLTDGCVETYSEGVDYFPQKAEVTHSSGFNIEYFDNYKVVTVNSPFPGAEEEATYLLVQCGTAVPDGFEEAVIIETPVDSFAAMSTTYLPHLPTLGVVDKLVGLDSLAFASTAAVRERIDAGEITEIGAGADVNVEQALDLDPDFVMTYSSGSADFDSQPKLEEAGITVVVNSDYLDTTPLGQAEWGKFLAAFFNQEAAANAWFEAVVAEYEALTAVAAAAEESPTVFVSSPFEGTWYMAGGKSYVAELLADAGASYLWADDESTSTLFLDFETVYDKASEADYWINIGFIASLADLAAADERFADFAAFQNGNVYNNDLRTNEFGGNDYYEGGAANPHWVLADLIKIFHPELLPDHEFVYYRLVE